MPVPLVVGAALVLLLQVALALPAGAGGGDDAHLLEEEDGVLHGHHPLGQHPPGGYEGVHGGLRTSSHQLGP